MKLYAVSSLLAGSVFALFTGFQLYFQQPESATVEAATTPVETPAQRLVFPTDLAPVAQSQAVPGAAAFSPAAKPHPIAVLRPSGSLHRWHEEWPEEWQASTVAQTELVLIVGRQKKTAIQRITYANNAPPITRYEYLLEVKVVEAKTGKLLAVQRFRNVPRPVLQVETWSTTALGRPVARSSVFRWVSYLAKNGFADDLNSLPIVNQLDF